MIALTPYQKDVRYVFDTIYRPMLARVTGGTAAQGYRFPTRKEADAEAWECARLHAGLWPRNAVFKIVDSAETDPWKEWRGNPNSPNANDRKKASVSTFVVRSTTNEVYDHRNRYFIPEPWATQLGFVNARFAANMSQEW